VVNAHAFFDPSTAFGLRRRAAAAVPNGAPAERSDPDRADGPGKETAELG
jgi:hypothetical protein